MKKSASKIIHTGLLFFMVFPAFMLAACATNRYSLGSLQTNEFDTTADLDQQALLYVPDEIQVWECDNQSTGTLLGVVWSSDRESEFIAVIPPGNHQLNIKFVQRVFHGTFTEYKTAENILVSDNFLAGHIYDIAFEIAGENSFFTREQVQVYIIDRTEDPGDEWPQWRETLKKIQTKYQAD
jgi:hypothetical protein